MTRFREEAMPMQNLLTNPSFNDGHHHQDDIAEIVVPDGWYLYYLDNVIFGDCEDKAYRPESVVWNISGAPEHEKDLFFLDGIYCLKVFKAWAPLYFALTQHVKGLIPGKRYRFTAQVFPDIVERYAGGTKVRPGDIWSAEARAGWSHPDIPWPEGQDGEIAWSDWFNEENENFEFGAYGDVWIEFTAPASGEVRVWLECKAKWGFQNNFFMDAFSLVAVDGEPEPPSGRSKLGPHVLRNAGRLPDVLSVKPAVAKFVGEWGMAASVSTGTLVIGRQHNREFTAEDQYRAGESPEDAARRFVNHQKATYQANPEITYWEGHNEPVWSDGDGMAWYAQFEIERMRLMHETGRKCILGNFSTGQPDLDLWPAFMPAIGYGLAANFEPILGLHEYSSPWMWWMTGPHQMDPHEDQGDEGWTTLRYRKVYRQHLIPNGLAIPLVITECGLDIVSPRPASYPAGAWRNLCDWWKLYHGANTDCAEFYTQQLLWYEQELLKDDYVVGATIFTWGNWGDPWNAFDVAGTQVEDKLIGHVRAWPGASFVYPVVDEPESRERGDPREQYERTYVLLHPGADWLWYATVAAATEEFRYTIGGSADDAGIGDLDVRRIIASNPAAWPGDLGAFFDAYYPGVAYEAIPSESPYEFAVLCRPEATDHRLSQNELAWRDEDFGEHPGGATIGQKGCLLASTAMVLRRVYGRGITPPILDRLLTLARAPYIDDVEMVNWGDAVGMFSAFDEALKLNRAFTATELRALLDGDWEVILRVSGGAHFVLLESVKNEETVGVTDPWDGQEKSWAISGVSGVRAAHVLVRGDESPIEPPPPPPPGDFTRRGIHDGTGGNYLIGQGLPGWCVIPAYIGTASHYINVQQYVANGVRPIVRLCYSYAVDDGGAGTMPGPGELGAFEAACVDTVKRSLEGLSVKEQDGVYWIYGNEMNNRREWPKDFELTPEYYVASFNRVWFELPPVALFGPGAIDPFNPGWGDWRETWAWALNHIIGADCIAMHAYCHDADLNRIDSDQRFSDAPLIGVHYDLLVASDQLDILPSWATSVPLLITECNHYERDDGAVGWNDDADEWMRLAYQKLAGLGIDAVCWFRYNYDQWKMNDKPLLLQALRELG
jgi:hypothetical protein